MKNKVTITFIAIILISVGAIFLTSCVRKDVGNKTCILDPIYSKGDIVYMKPDSVPAVVVSVNCSTLDLVYFNDHGEHVHRIFVSREYLH